mgnify:CR=1 FL=1
MENKTVMSAFQIFAQSGRAMYDINKKTYRIRKVSRDPIDGSKLRFANEREEQARIFADTDAANLVAEEILDNGNKRIAGVVTDKSKKYQVEIVFNKDEMVVGATCSCYYFQQNKLFKGPCEHIIALNIQSKKKKSTMEKLINLF